MGSEVSKPCFNSLEFMSGPLQIDASTSTVNVKTPFIRYDRAACAAYLGCTPTGDNGDNYNACTYLDPQSVSVSIIKANGQAGPDYGCEAIAFPWAPSGVSGDPFSAIQGDCVLTPVEGIENSGDFYFELTGSTYTFIDGKKTQRTIEKLSSTNFAISVDLDPPTPTPSTAFIGSRRRNIRSAREQARLGIMQTSIPLANGGHEQCLRGHNACPVMGTLRWECVDVMSDLDNCGGCEGSINARDCTAIEGAEDVTCINGNCRVWSCEKGYQVGDDEQSCWATLE